MNWHDVYWGMPAVWREPFVVCEECRFAILPTMLHAARLPYFCGWSMAADWALP